MWQRYAPLLNALVDGVTAKTVSGLLKGIVNVVFLIHKARVTFDTHTVHLLMTVVTENTTPANILGQACFQYL